MNKKAQISFMIVFIIFAIIIILMATALVPLGNDLTEFSYEQGEFLLNESLAASSGIQNTTNRNQIQTDINDAIAEGETNRDITREVIKYSWVIALALISIIIFIATRQQIQQASRVV